MLTTCGHTVGLKQSPSVVFSSSSDLAVEKQGAGQQSSSEEASITEGLSNDSGKDELESQQVSLPYIVTNRTEASRLVPTRESLVDFFRDFCFLLQFPLLLNA